MPESINDWFGWFVKRGGVVRINTFNSHGQAEQADQYRCKEHQGENKAMLKRDFRFFNIHDQLRSLEKSFERSLR